MHILDSIYYVKCHTCMHTYTHTHIRGKKILKLSLVPRASKVKFLLVLLPNNLLEIYFQINLHRIFYLTAGHWVKIYACPA